MAKTFEIIKSGRKSLEPSILNGSLGTYRVETSDLNISVGHLLEATPDMVVFGTCVNAAHRRWEVIRIAKSQLRTMIRLSS